MKIVNRIELQQKYHELLVKYNTISLKYETLLEDTKSESYKAIMKYLEHDDQIEHYKNENKKLRNKVKELKQSLKEKEGINK